MSFFMAKPVITTLYSASIFTYTVKTVFDSGVVDDYVKNIHRDVRDPFVLSEVSRTFKRMFITVHDYHYLDDYLFIQAPIVEIPIPRCELLRVPSVCTPEYFNKLLIEGRISELRALEQMCYIKPEYINLLLECYQYLKIILEAISESINR